MTTLPTIAADLAAYIAARVTYLTRAAEKNSALALTPAQHLETARVLMTAERYIVLFESSHPTPGETVDLVGALDAFYTGLAHLAMAYHIHWAIPEGSDAAATDAAPRGDVRGDDDESPVNDP